jgi:hypothetical protein
MDENDRDFPPEQWQARIEAACRRRMEGLPPVSWLPRVCDLPALRRLVRLLRAGKVKPYDSRFSAWAWSDALEEGILLYELEIKADRQRIKEEDEREAERQRKVRNYNESWMEVYRLLKEMPEASDPNSEIAAQVLSMKRELRKLRGRWRKGKRRRRGIHP